MCKRWKPSKIQAKKFKKKMDAITDFCEKNNIYQSAAGDSYYFTLGGQKYRVSNHTPEASDAAAYDEITGEQRRELYHNGRDAGTVYITASKIRIIEIYNDLKAGKKLNKRGYVVEV